MSAPRSKNFQLGFSLVELILVVTLISVVVGLGVVRFVGHYQTAEWDNAINDMTFLLRFLQAKAIQDGKVYKIHSDSPDNMLSVSQKLPWERDFSAARLQSLQHVRRYRSLRATVENRGSLFLYPDGTLSRDRLMLENDSGERIFVSLKNRIGLIQLERH